VDREEVIETKDGPIVTKDGMIGEEIVMEVKVEEEVEVVLIKEGLVILLIIKDAENSKMRKKSK
jgi:hypothetical protein